MLIIVPPLVKILWRPESFDTEDDEPVNRDMGVIKLKSICACSIPIVALNRIIYSKVKKIFMFIIFGANFAKSSPRTLFVETEISTKDGEFGRRLGGQRQLNFSVIEGSERY